ncbi:MAG TPA: transporter associated domain-containing protein [Steroidobacteraceae bacterium]|nr:transporter associated domain-containing protein [Steroidobacteraceae bacterium]
MDFAAALALLALAGLVEAAMPALRSRRAAPASLAEPWIARLSRRMADEPRRTRLAAVLLRALLIAALFACIALAPPESQFPLALTVLAGLALLVLLGASGWLRRDGVLRRLAALPVAWLAAPLFLVLPRSDAAAAPREEGDAALDLADALAAEPAERQAMVEALLGLERRRVEQVMVPRTEIDGIDIASDWDEISGRLRETAHTRMPLFDGDLDRVQGIVHMRLVANELASGRLTRDRLKEIATRREALFTPEGTTLYEQLLRFRRLRRRIAFVVDEYGDLQGLVTLEDILEEVVGEFTTQVEAPLSRIDALGDGSHVVPGGLSLREINRRLGADFPLDGPRTLSGLIVDRLESIPEAGAVLRVGSASIEVLQVAGNAVRTARLSFPPRSE